MKPNDILREFVKYKSQLSPFHEQMRKNEELFKQVQGSPFLQNAMWTKHADAMDNFPAATFLPTHENARKSASLLCKVFPIMLEQMDFEQTYSDFWWAKLKHGTACMGTFFDGEQVVIKNIDMKRLYFNTQVNSIEQSPFVFYVSVVQRGPLEKKYGPVSDSLQVSSLFEQYGLSEGSELTCVLDCYYKKGGRLQMKKLWGDKIIFDSEKTPRCKEGMYPHGQYPFVLDVLIPAAGTPLGYGLTHLVHPMQQYIDKLDRLVLENAAVAGKQRYLVREGSGVDINALSDLDVNFIPCDLSTEDNAIRPLQANSLPGFIMNHRNSKIAELKDISGNRDFTTGGVMGGITAYSAIVALQEAGNKLSRDMISGSYRTFKKVTAQAIQLLCGCDTKPRVYYIDDTFVAFKGADILPHIDVRIIPQKKSPFTVAAHNQLVLDLYKAGGFAPERQEQTALAISSMYLEGKEELLSKLSKEG